MQYLAFLNFGSICNDDYLRAVISMTTNLQSISDFLQNGMHYQSRESAILQYKHIAWFLKLLKRKRRKKCLKTSILPFGESQIMRILAFLIYSQQKRPICVNIYFYKSLFVCSTCTVANSVLWFTINIDLITMEINYQYSGRASNQTADCRAESYRNTENIYWYLLYIGQTSTC